MRPTPLSALALTTLSVAAAMASAQPTYIALGDSITFGETDLSYVPSLGDRGYVGLFADHLAMRLGSRPTVYNFAIDGETTGSFNTGAGRTTPVMGRNDAALAAQNLNYTANPALPQRDLFRNQVAAQHAAGHTINDVSVTLGFNNIGALTPLADPLAALPAALAAYESEYRAILTDVRLRAPEADLYILNYFNPFPANPANPALPLFTVAGPLVNGIIQRLAGEFGGLYVDTATPFMGHEAAFTYLDEMPAGFSVPAPLPGVLPIGNVHPNSTGYAAIAAQVFAVPGPGGLTIVGLALVAGRPRRNAAVR